METSPPEKEFYKESMEQEILRLSEFTPASSQVVWQVFLLSLHLTRLLNLATLPLKGKVTI